MRFEDFQKLQSSAVPATSTGSTQSLQQFVQSPEFAKLGPTSEVYQKPEGNESLQVSPILAPAAGIGENIANQTTQLGTMALEPANAVGSILNELADAIVNQRMPSMDTIAEKMGTGHKLMEPLLYQPKTEAGQNLQGAISDVLTSVPKGVDALDDLTGSNFKRDYPNIYGWTQAAGELLPFMVLAKGVHAGFKSSEPNPLLKGRQSVEFENELATARPSSDLPMDSTQATPVGEVQITPEATAAAQSISEMVNSPVMSTTVEAAKIVDRINAIESTIAGREITPETKAELGKLTKERDRLQRRYGTLSEDFGGESEAWPAGAAEASAAPKVEVPIEPMESAPDVLTGMKEHFDAPDVGDSTVYQSPNLLAHGNLVEDLLVSTGIKSRVAILERNDLGRGAEVPPELKGLGERLDETGNYGLVKAVETPTGKHYVAVINSDAILRAGKAGDMRMLEGAIHEAYGHIVVAEKYGSASADTKISLATDFARFANLSPEEASKEFYPLKTSEIAIGVPEGMDNETKFKEWLVNGIVKWTTSAEKPVGLVNKWFAQVAEAFKAAWEKAQGQAPAESIQAWMESLFDTKRLADADTEVPHLEVEDHTPVKKVSLNKQLEILKKLVPETAAGRYSIGTVEPASLQSRRQSKTTLKNAKVANKNTIGVYKTVTVKQTDASGKETVKKTEKVLIHKFSSTSRSSAQREANLFKYAHALATKDLVDQTPRSTRFEYYRGLLHEVKSSGILKWVAEDQGISEDQVWLNFLADPLSFDPVNLEAASRIVRMDEAEERLFNKVLAAVKRSDIEQRERGDYRDNIIKRAILVERAVVAPEIVEMIQAEPILKQEMEGTPAPGEPAPTVAEKRRVIVRKRVEAAAKTVEAPSSKQQPGLMDWLEMASDAQKVNEQKDSAKRDAVANAMAAQGTPVSQLEMAVRDGALTQFEANEVYKVLAEDRSLSIDQVMEKAGLTEAVEPAAPPEVSNQNSNSNLETRIREVAENNVAQLMRAGTKVNLERIQGAVERTLGLSGKELREAKKWIKDNYEDLKAGRSSVDAEVRAEVEQHLADMKVPDDVSVDEAAAYMDLLGDMVVWHGSPHEFDKFSLDKIGSGEGAQVYGHGLYFAGKRKVAEWYKDKLTRGQGGEIMKIGTQEWNLKLSGTDTPPSQAAWQIQRAFLDLKNVHNVVGDDTQIYNRAIRSQKAFLRSLKSHVAESLDKVTMYEKAVEKDPNDNFVRTLLQNAEREHSYNERKLITNEYALEYIERWQKNGDALGYEERRAGKLYQVELAPEEHEFLSWDTPIRDQPQHIRDAIEKLSGPEPEMPREAFQDFEAAIQRYASAKFEEGVHRDQIVEDTSYMRRYPNSSEKLLKKFGLGEDTLSKIVNYNLAMHKYRDYATGADFYQDLSKSLPGGPAEASERLHEAGIRGIKYLDGMSRSRGEGDHNYVIFNDEDAKITDVSDMAVRRKAAKPITGPLYDKPIKMKKIAKLKTAAEIAEKTRIRLEKEKEFVDKMSVLETEADKQSVSLTEYLRGTGMDEASIAKALRRYIRLGKTIFTDQEHILRLGREVGLVDTATGTQGLQAFIKTVFPKAQGPISQLTITGRDILMKRLQDEYIKKQGEKFDFSKVPTLAELQKMELEAQKSLTKWQRFKAGVAYFTGQAADELKTTPAGAELVHLLRNVITTESALYTRDYFKRLHDYSTLITDPQDREHVLNVYLGTEAPRNKTFEGAANLMREIYAYYGMEMENVGVQLVWKGGARSKFKFDPTERHFPHMWEPGSFQKPSEKQLNSLTISGMPVDPKQARAIIAQHGSRMRRLSAPRFANLEMARELDMDGWIKDPFKVTASYLKRGANRLAILREVGQDPEVRLAQLAWDHYQQAKDPDALNFAVKVINATTGVSTHEPLMKKALDIVGVVEFYAMASALQHAALIQPSVVTNIATSAGWKNTVKGFYRYVKSDPRKASMSREWADVLGASSRSIGTELMHELMDTNSLQSRAGKLLNYWGVTKVDRWLRDASTLVGQLHVNDMLERAINLGDKKAERELNRLGLTSREVKAALDAGDNYKVNEYLKKGSYAFSQMTNLLTDPLTTPTWQMEKTSWGRLLTLFGRFSFLQHHYIKETIKDNPKALAKYLTNAIAVGVPIYTVRQIAKGQNPVKGFEEGDLFGTMFAILQSGAGLGMFGDMAGEALHMISGSGRYSGFDRMGGPMIGLGTEAVQGVKQIAHGNLDSASALKLLLRAGTVGLAGLAPEKWGPAAAAVVGAARPALTTLLADDHKKK